MSTPDPMPPRVNPNDVDDSDNGTSPTITAQVGIVSAALSCSSQSGLDPIAEPSEDELNEQFSRQIAKRLMEEYTKANPLIGSNGELSDEENRKMFADFRARMKAEWGDLKSELKKLPSLVPEVGILLKFVETLLDILDLGPDEDPERIYETMFRQFLRKDVLQEVLEILCTCYVHFIATLPASKERRHHIKELACLSKMVEVFDESDYRPDHPGYLMKLLEIESEMESNAPDFGPHAH